MELPPGLGTPRGSGSARNSAQEEHRRTPSEGKHTLNRTPDIRPSHSPSAWDGSSWGYKSRENIPPGYNDTGVQPTSRRAAVDESRVGSQPCTRGRPGTGSGAGPRTKARLDHGLPWCLTMPSEQETIPRNTLPDSSMQQRRTFRENPTQPRTAFVHQEQTRPVSRSTRGWLDSPPHPTPPQEPGTADLVP